MTLTLCLNLRSTFIRHPHRRNDDVIDSGFALHHQALAEKYNYLYYTTVLQYCFDDYHKKCHKMACYPLIVTEQEYLACLSAD